MIPNCIGSLSLCKKMVCELHCDKPSWRVLILSGTDLGLLLGWLFPHFPE